MAFEKEPRYVVTRIHEDGGHRVYMSGKGGETSIRSEFGATWSYHEPGRWTLHQASIRCAEGNDMIGPWMPKGPTDHLWKVVLYSDDYSWN